MGMLRANVDDIKRFFKYVDKLPNGNRPGTLAWWIDQEAKRSAPFSSRFSYSDIQRRSREQPDLYGGFFNDDPDMDAECGLWCGD